MLNSSYYPTCHLPHFHEIPLERGPFVGPPRDIGIEVGAGVNPVRCQHHKGAALRHRLGVFPRHLAAMVGQVVCRLVHECLGPLVTLQAIADAGGQRHVMEQVVEMNSAGVHPTALEPRVDAEEAGDVRGEGEVQEVPPTAAR